MCSRKGRTVQNPWTSIPFSSLFCFPAVLPLSCTSSNFHVLCRDCPALSRHSILPNELSYSINQILMVNSRRAMQHIETHRLPKEYSYIHSKQVSSQFTQWQAWIQIFAEFTDTNPPGHIWWFCAKIRWDQSRSSSANYLQESRCQAFFAGIHSLAFSC